MLSKSPKGQYINLLQKIWLCLAILFTIADLCLGSLGSYYLHEYDFFQECGFISLVIIFIIIIGLDFVTVILGIAVSFCSRRDDCWCLKKRKEISYRALGYMFDPHITWTNYLIALLSSIACLIMRFDTTQCLDFLTDHYKLYALCLAHLVKSLLITMSAMIIKLYWLKIEN